jgi:phage I-like protein
MFRPRRPGEARLTIDLGVKPGSGPPTEFRIFAKGTFRSLNEDTGRADYQFTDASAKSVIAKAVKKGTDFFIDYEHQSVNTQGRAPAAAYFKLALRNGELWAVDIEWTATGAADLTSGTDANGKRTPPHYRYFSPVFTYDTKTGIISELINLALTNMPATRDMQPIAASYRPRPPLGTLSQHRRIPSSFVAHRAGEKAPTNMAKNSGAARATDAAFATLTSAHETATASLTASNLALSSSNDDLRAKLSEANSAAAISNATIKAKDEVIAALTAQAKDVAAIVGKDNLAEAKGAFAALKAEIGKVAELSEKLAKIEVEAKTAKLTQMIDKAMAEGKILPAEKDAFLKADISFVEEIVKVRQPLVKLNETPSPVVATPAAALDIDPEIVALAKANGWDVDKISKQTAGRA